MEIVNNQETVTCSEPISKPDVARPVKRKLAGYLLLSAAGFSYLVFAPRAGVSVLVFAALQAVYLCFLLPKKKALLALVPVGVFALNAFISANGMWRLPNLLIALVLYNVMALWLTHNLGLKETLPRFLQNIGGNMLRAVCHFGKPFEWGAEAQKEHLPVIKRVCIGLGISIPILLFLLVMLSMADAIFSHTLARFVDWLSGLMGIDTLIRIFFGILAGLTLFGILYGAHRDSPARTAVLPKVRRGDLMILNIALVSALLIYTLFVAIQFRYLFAPPDNLPYGLDFVHYARRGFFELLALTGVNILFILIAVWLSKTQTGKGAKLTKILCLYLCTVTVVLLVSSFYRMWLYGSDDGLTRLRFLVFGFLMFEAIGLIATFFYIIRPKFNIIAVYCVIGLTYYLLLNIVPMDRIIARDQINRYFETGRGGIVYTVSLSPDAAPEIERLLTSDDPETRQRAEQYFQRMDHMANNRTNWRQWNLSIDRAARGD